MSILLIDNYDSFTYNLVHYLQELGADVQVVRNDAMSAAEILSSGAQAVVISPGPSDPEHAGVCLPFLAANAGKLPVLGVCLGHQAIGQAYGGKVIRAPQAIHGKTSPMLHEGKSVFAGLPSPFNATRYHSLVVERDTLPAELEITAETQDGLIMGLRHRTHNVHGVQFHPESIASEHGHAMLKNFLQLAGVVA
jgi:anthranilate synthase component 2